MAVDTKNHDGYAQGRDEKADDATYTSTSTGSGTGSQPNPTMPSASEADDQHIDEKVCEFLARCGSTTSAIAAAHGFVRANFPGYEVAPAPFQGYCSYTVLLLPPSSSEGGRRDSGVEAGGGGSNSGSSSSESSGGSGKGLGAGVGDASNKLVQFRPRRHSIDVGICAEARGVFGGGVVPRVEDLGVLAGLETSGPNGDDDGELCAYALEKVGGVSLTEFRASSALTGTDPRASRRRIVADLAVVFADSWRGRRDGRDVAKGKIGGSLRWRLDVMAKGLPREFRGVVGRAAKELDEVARLPWVVTHGDLVPDNIMVHPPCEDGDRGKKGSRRLRDMMERAGGVVGLIDWAEAEWLPFGVGMYGLEEVLGEDVPLEEDDGHKSGVSNATGTSGNGTAGTRFVYYPEASALRSLFWDEVGRVVGDEEVIRRAKRAQVLGVLLWRGIAFDDGALGRVVDDGRDWWDLQRLRVWLFGEDGIGVGDDAGGTAKGKGRSAEGGRGAWVRRVWKGVRGLVRRCFKDF